MKHFGKKINILIALSTVLTMPFFAITSCAQQENPQPKPKPPVIRDLFSIKNSIIRGFNPILSTDQILNIIGDNILKIPNGIIGISDNAFYKNDASTIPEQVIGISFADALELKSIGANAFRGANFKKFTLPPKLEFIGEYAFAEAGLEYINLSRKSGSNSSLTVEKNAFFHNSNLSELILVPQITDVKDNAFAENDNLKSIDFSAFSTLPPSWSGKNIFSNSGNINTVIFAFDEFKSDTLKEYLLSQGINEQVGYLFATSYYDMDIIPSTQTYVLTGFLDGSSCKKICDDFHTTILPIPNIVTEIDDQAFFNNDRSTLLDSVTSINFPVNLTRIGHEAFRIAKINKVEFPEKLDYIGRYAFAGCINLAEAHFNKDLKEIDNSAFEDCESVVFRFGGETTRWQDVIRGTDWHKGYQYDIIACDDKTCNVDLASTPYDYFEWSTREDHQIVLQKFIKETDVPSEIFIPAYRIERQFGGRIYTCEKITAIADNAFRGNNNITDVVIPNTIETIGASVFEQSSLKKVTLSKNINYLGEAVFAQCTNLEEVVGNLGEIEEAPKNCFLSCPNLPSIALTGYTRTINEGFICGCTKLFTIEYDSNSDFWGMVSRPRGENSWYTRDPEGRQKVHCIDQEVDFDYESLK